MVRRSSGKKNPRKRIFPKTTKTEKHPSIIVGVGASAGGLDALQHLLSALGKSSGLTMVIVQHLDPARKSQTAEILSRLTARPVREIEDQMPIEANRVYVNPPGFSVTVSKGVFHLVQRSRDPVDPMAIDLFFNSLAKDRKSRAVGVVLSGTGSDGTLGLASIGAEGGVTFAQEPKTAKQGAMPQNAINSGFVDFILSPGEIANELMRMNGQNVEKPPSSDWVLPLQDTDALQKIFDLVRNQTLIDFTDYKPSTVGRRIQRQMRAYKQESMSDYADFLGSHEGAVKSLCEDMFIHVTEFFRDADSFLSLKESVFPRILKSKAMGAPIRIWVPGCSTGEEAYSLVISLLEFLGSEAAKTPIQIFATDISEEAVQAARAGIYSEQQVQSLSPQRLKRFFDLTKDGYKVKKTIRDLCVFSRHDVANNPPFAKIDLISCRNVLIYFGPTLQMKVLPIFHYSLNPDGILWLGRSEAPSGFSKLFTLIDKTNKIYSKINTATSMSFRFPTGRNLPEHHIVTKRDLVPPLPAIDSLRDFDRFVMARYAPAGVVINSDLEILQVRGRTGLFLEFPAGQPSYNFLKALRPELLPNVRMSIQDAMKHNAPSRKEGLAYEFGNQRRRVNVEVIPANPKALPKERQFYIIFEDSIESETMDSTEIPLSKSKKTTRKGSDSNESYISHLLEELDSLREYQQSLAEGYESTQEELTSANEELQSTNEELQSTNEEMETAKEELQAANEELTTINDELQDRNSELNSLNADLAREKLYVQLFEMITEAANEVTTIEAALELFVERICAHEKWAIGHVFLKSEDGQWKSTDIWHLDDSIKLGEFRRATENIRWTSKTGMIAVASSHPRPILIPNVEQDAVFTRKEVAAKLGLRSAFVMPVQVGQSTAIIIEFLAAESRKSDAKLLEVMAYMSPQLGRTIERKRAIEAAIREEAQKSTILTTALDCIIYMDQDGMIREFNPAAERTFGHRREDVVGRELAELIIPPSIRNSHRNGLARLRATGEEKMLGRRMESIGVRRDGTEFPIELSVTQVPGDPPLFAGFIRDITERKRAEEVLKRSHAELEKLVQDRTNTLKESERRFRLMVEGVKDYAIFQLDPTGRIISWNEGARQLKGYRSDEIIGKHFSIFYSEIDKKSRKPEWEIERATATGRIEDEGWRIRKDGSKFWANVIITRINDEEGEIVGFSKITRDLTERKEAEEKIRMTNEGLERTVQERTSELTQALSLRDEFLSIASHELKTPLTSLKLQLQISERSIKSRIGQTPSVEHLAQSYQLALKQVNSLTDLVEDLLDTSRIRTGKFILSVSEVNLSELVGDVVTRFAEPLKAAQCSLELNLERGVVGSWDRHRLEQVAVNLISNALKYAPKNPITVSTQKNGDRARLIVQDRGPGIEKDKHERIFDRFERANRSRDVGGLGLGLFIAKKIVEAHHGTISVESEADTGARFIVDIPTHPNLSPNESEGN